MSRRAVGSPMRIVAWARRHATEGRYVLAVDGMHERTVVGEWPSECRDAGEDWAEEVLELAQDDADGRGGLTAYLLQWEDAQGERRASYVIRRRPRGGDDRDLEGPSVEGIIAQQLRHTEALARQLAQVVQQTSAHQAQVLELVTRRLEALEKERGQVLEAEAEATRALARLEAEDGSAEVEARREQRIDQLLGLIVPRLLASATSGSGGSTGSGSPS